MSFDHSDTDDWQLAPEPLTVDRPKLLLIEQSEEPVKLCKECDEPMYKREELYDICQFCSRKYGLIRTCDHQ